MTRVTIEEAQARLPELIAGLKPGEFLQITKDDWPVAQVVAQPPRRRGPRQAGSAVGRLFIVEDDEPPSAPRRPGWAIGHIKVIEEDESHLDDFKDYMP